MFTIFTIPKPFQGHIGTIQRNAIQSWTLLHPRPEIILFGSEAGTAQVAAELRVTDDAFLHSKAKFLKRLRAEAIDLQK